MEFGRTKSRKREKNFKSPFANFDTNTPASMGKNLETNHDKKEQEMKKKKIKSVDKTLKSEKSTPFDKKKKSQKTKICGDILDLDHIFQAVIKRAHEENMTENYGNAFETQNCKLEKKKRLHNPNGASKENGKKTCIFKKTDKAQLSRKEKMQKRKIIKKGTWVQCSFRNCQKWRFLFDEEDPSVIQEQWTCDMNRDDEYNTCEKPEQDWRNDESERDYIISRYTEGSIIWAKMNGYPWWPAMIEIDPDTGFFYEVEFPESVYPNSYHVVFFGDTVTRAWIKVNAMKPFLLPEVYYERKFQKSKVREKILKDLSSALISANKALECSIVERLKLFGFSNRFHGKWGETILVGRKAVKLGEEKGMKESKTTIPDQNEKMDDEPDEQSRVTLKIKRKCDPKQNWTLNNFNIEKIRDTRLQASFVPNIVPDQNVINENITDSNINEEEKKILT